MSRMWSISGGKQKGRGHCPKTDLHPEPTCRDIRYEVRYWELNGRNAHIADLLMLTQSRHQRADFTVTHNAAPTKVSPEQSLRKSRGQRTNSGTLAGLCHQLLFDAFARERTNCSGLGGFYVQEFVFLASSAGLPVACEIGR